MNTLLKSLTAFLLIAMPAAAADAPDLMARLAQRALKQGSDASLNASFATTLGLNPGGKPIPLKRLSIGNKDSTNIFNLSLADKKTIVLTERKGNLSTFFLTDTNGALKKAIVNNTAIANGGMTNLPLPQARLQFDAHRAAWLKLLDTP